MNRGPLQPHHADQHFAVGYLGLVYVPEVRNIRLAVSVLDDRLHGLSLPAEETCSMPSPESRSASGHLNDLAWFGVLTMSGAVERRVWPFTIRTTTSAS